MSGKRSKEDEMKKYVDDFFSNEDEDIFAKLAAMEKKRSKETKTYKSPATSKASTSNPSTSKASIPNPSTSKASTPNPFISKALTPIPSTSKAPNPFSSKASTPIPSTSKASTPSTSKDDEKFGNPEFFFQSQTPLKSQLKKKSPKKKPPVDDWSKKFDLPRNTKEKKSESDKWGSVIVLSDDSDKQTNDPWFSDDVWGDDITNDMLHDIFTNETNESKSKSVLADFQNVETTHMDYIKQITENSVAKVIKSSPTVQNESKKNRTQKTEEKPKNPFYNTREMTKPSLFPEATQKQTSFPASQKPEQKLNIQQKPKSSMESQKPELKPVQQTPKSFDVESEKPELKSNVQQKPKSFDFESQKLTPGQKKLEKPVKSLPPTTSVQTEWLRSQLEKANSQCKILQENVQLKEGETKLLREKLMTAENKIEKQKLEMTLTESDKTSQLENKIKQLEKELESARTQMLFKTKEFEASKFTSRDFEIEEDEIEPYSKTEAHKNFCAQLKSGQNQNYDVLFKEITDDKWPEFIKGKVIKKLDVNKDAISELTKAKEKLRKEILKSGKKRENVGKRLSSMLPPDFELAANREANHFTTPVSPYAFNLLTDADLTDKHMDNYTRRRPTLFDLWDFNYDEFGPTKLTPYEQTSIGKKVELDYAKTCILNKQRHYSTLEEIRGDINALKLASEWNKDKIEIGRKIITHVTGMARELFATLGEVRYRQEHATVHIREKEIIDQCYDLTELDDTFSPFSPNKWKNESYVDLRRGIALVGLLCARSAELTEFVLDPRGVVKAKRKMRNYQTKTSQLLPFIQDPRSSIPELKSAYHRPPERLKIDKFEKIEFLNRSIQMDTDDDSPSESKNPPAWKKTSVPEVTENVGGLTLYEKAELKFEVMMAKRELEMIENNLEIKERKKYFHKKETDKKETDKKETDEKETEKKESVFVKMLLEDKEKYIESMKSHLEGDHYKIDFGMPKEKSTEYTKKLYNKILVNIDLTRSRVKDYRNEDIPKDIDFSGLCKRKVKQPEKAEEENIFVKEVVEHGEKYKKRKCEQIMDRLRTKKHKLEALGESLGGDEQLEEIFGKKEVKKSDVSKLPDSRGKKMLIALQSSEISIPETNLIKESDVEKKRKEADEDEPFSEPMWKLNQPEYRVRLKTTIDEIIDGVELDHDLQQKLEDHFIRDQTCAEEDDEGNSDSSDFGDDSEESDEDEEYVESDSGDDLGVQMPRRKKKSTKHKKNSDENDPRFTDFRVRLKIMNTPRPDHQYISDAVEIWNKKLKNAAFLELICEICKDGGVLRFVPRLNALMMSIVFMLEAILLNRGKECRPHLNKIVTVLREVVYIRPSPLVLYYVNRFIAQAIELEGFAIMLCHNADPRTFSVRDQAWVRGACLTEVLCLIMDSSLSERFLYKTARYFMSWVYYICHENSIGRIWCRQVKYRQRRCECLTAILNTVLHTAFEVITSYQALILLTDDEKNGEGRKKDETHNVPSLKEMIVQGLYILHFFVEYDPYVSHRIQNRYEMFSKFVRIIQNLNKSDISDFSLTPCQVKMVEILKNQEFNKEYEKEYVIIEDVPDFSEYFENNKHWISERLRTKLIETDSDSD